LMRELECTRDDTRRHDEKIAGWEECRYVD
jgi:hypothetical protein